VEKLLKVLAITLGGSLILGETLRSRGQARPLAFVLDDFLIGGGLIAGALWFRANELRRRAAFAAAWGASEARSEAGPSGVSARAKRAARRGGSSTRGVRPSSRSPSASRARSPRA
jgi:hypothetical protein